MGDGARGFIAQPLYPVYFLLPDGDDSAASDRRPLPLRLPVMTDLLLTPSVQINLFFH